MLRCSPCVCAASTAQSALLSQQHSEASINLVATQRKLHAQQEALVEYVNRIHINRISAARARPPRNLYTATSLHGSASPSKAARAAIQARGHALVRGRRAAPTHAQAGLPRDGEVLRPVRPDGVPAVPPEGAAARAARFASSTRGVKRLPEPPAARHRDVPGRRQGRSARGVRYNSLRRRRVTNLSQHTGGYSDQNRAQNVFNNCVGKVFDAHASMLGDVKKRIEKGLR